jgi:hypothetical protein
MRKFKIFGITIITVAISVIAISAKSTRNDKNEKISKNYKDISQYDLKDFINMDLGVIGYFPTKKHWKKIDKNIETVPVDSLRYIDSLDIAQIVDTLFVKVYSQNYAYQSTNVYSIAKNKNKSTDKLMIYNIDINLKMKDIIADAQTFRTKDFVVNFIVKQNIDTVDKRIIINKNYR